MMSVLRWLILAIFFSFFFYFSFCFLFCYFVIFLFFPYFFFFFFVVGTCTYRKWTSLYIKVNVYCNPIFHFACMDVPCRCEPMNHVHQWTRCISNSTIHTIHLLGRREQPLLDLTYFCRAFTYVLHITAAQYTGSKEIQKCPGNWLYYVWCS